MKPDMVIRPMRLPRRSVNQMAPSRPAAIPAVVDSAIRIGAKVVWMQLDIEHPQAAEKARTAGIIVVMNACILVEHKRRRQI